MSDLSLKLEKSDRSLLQRLFEAPAIGKMSLTSKLLSYSVLWFGASLLFFPICRPLKHFSRPRGGNACP